MDSTIPSWGCGGVPGGSLQDDCCGCMGPVWTNLQDARRVWFAMVGRGHSRVMVLALVNLQDDRCMSQRTDG